MGLVVAQIFRLENQPETVYFPCAAAAAEFSGGGGDSGRPAGKSARNSVLFSGFPEGRPASAPAAGRARLGTRKVANPFENIGFLIISGSKLSRDED